MKSTPKKILSLFMSLLMLLSVTSGLTFTSFADDTNADVSFEYTENDDGTINITGFTAGEDSTGNLDIPSKIDGKLTASDARAILRIAAKLDNPDDITKSAADINSDGKVTSAEARNILRFAARLANTIDG